MIRVGSTSVVQGAFVVSIVADGVVAATTAAATAAEGGGGGACGEETLTFASSVTSFRRSFFFRTNVFVSKLFSLMLFVIIVIDWQSSGDVERTFSTG